MMASRRCSTSVTGADWYCVADTCASAAPRCRAISGAAGAATGRVRASGGGAPRAPRNAAFDGMAWGIDQWDAKKVEAALKSRGLSPVADNHGDFQSFHVKDPDGFNVWITNANRKTRRTTPANGKTSAPAPFESTTWKTVWLDHISFEVTELQGVGRVLSRAAWLEAWRGRRQPELGRD